MRPHGRGLRGGAEGQERDHGLPLARTSQVRLETSHEKNMIVDYIIRKTSQEEKMMNIFLWGEEIYSGRLWGDKDCFL